MGRCRESYCVTRAVFSFGGSALSQRYEHAPTTLGSDVGGEPSVRLGGKVRTSKGEPLLAQLGQGPTRLFAAAGEEVGAAVHRALEVRKRRFKLVDG